MNSELEAPPKTIWTNPTAEDEQPTLIYFKADALCYATIPPGDLDKTVDLLRAGNDVASHNIPFAALDSVTGTVGDSDLEVHFTQGNSKAEPVTLTLSDTGQRDQFLENLVQRLGPTWQREEKPGNRLYEAMWPAIFTTGAVLLTWFMYGEAQEIAAGRQLPVGGRAKTRLIGMVMHYVEGLIGTTGVLLLGGALTVLLLFWTCYSLVFTPMYFKVRPT